MNYFVYEEKEERIIPCMCCGEDAVGIFYPDEGHWEAICDECMKPSPEEVEFVPFEPYVECSECNDMIWNEVHAKMTKMFYGKYLCECCVEDK